MKVTLMVVDGYIHDRGRRFVLAADQPDNVTLGRAPRPSDNPALGAPHVQVSSKDPRMSRWHCLVQMRPPNCYINDLGSTNGTYVNDVRRNRPVEEATVLRHGDSLSLGRTRLRVGVTADNADKDQKSCCARCGRPFQGPDAKSGEQGIDDDPFCPNCGAKESAQEPGTHAKWLRLDTPVEGAKSRKGKAAPAPGAASAQVVQDSAKTAALTCLSCACDVTDRAANDGSAAQFRGVALYLCERCAKAERADTEQVADYWLLRKLGAGGMGVVYKAWHKVTGRVVAIKQLLPDLVMDDRAMKIFHREIAVCRQLVHANIVRYYESFNKKHTPYLVTEFLPGGNADALLLTRKQPLEVATACAIISDVLEGLAFAHAKGIVHRDVTPQNVLFDVEGRAKISDMGLAKSFELAGQSGITGVGETGGKPLYMAPEQYLNYRFVKPAADVYSVGVCLYYFITGRFPYEFPSPLDALMGAMGLKKVRHPIAIILEDEPTPVRRRRNDVPQALAAVVQQCLRKDANQRYADANELRAAIHDALH